MLAKSTQFKQMLESKQLEFILEAHNGLSAKIVEETGFKGIWGSTHTVATGREKRQVVVDEEYIKSSIYDPNTDVVEGYGKGLMLSYRGQLSEEDITNIIEYLKTIK